MPTHRDEVRAARHEAYKVAKALGIDMTAERSKIGSDQRTLTHDALKLINDQTPRTNREQLTTDDPPTGAFDGANTIFILSSPVDGENIAVIWGDSSTPQTIPLTKGNANPPAVNSFFFDTNDPTVIIVNPPPQAADRLIAVFKAKR